VRGELEIKSLPESYLKEGNLTVEKMARGFAWLDTGTHGSLLDAGNFVKTITERQVLQVGSPDEVAYQLGWVTSDQLHKTANKFGKNKYGDYLLSLARSSK
jgi:glucose-1-phosphate thymidylyltransferase